MPSFFEQFRDFLAPRFRLERKLGAGGMGTVYLAEDTLLHRHVAVKALLREHASALAERRFLREARILADLQHPNIVPVHDVGRETDPFTYYIMEYLDGETLDQRLKRGPLPARDVVRLGLDLLDALHEAHRRGVIHRDVKPSNIFLVKGRGVLVDFGVAKTSSDSGSDLTQPGQVVGTRSHMAPEQLVGRELPQSDLYSLGMVLYEAVTGRYRDGTDSALAEVPLTLRSAVRRALAWSPEERWPDARAFRRALSRPRLIALAPARGALAAGGVGLAGLIVWAILRFSNHRVDLGIERFRTSGVSSGIGDSIARRIADRLTGFPDFTVAGPGRTRHARAVVSGSWDVTGADLVVRLQLHGQEPVSFTTADTAWQSAADLLADSVLVRVYRASQLDAQLPVRVLPRDPEGLRAFLSAEKAFARASWDSAYTGYAEADAIDPSCVLCAWRHAEVARFLALPRDTADGRVYAAQLGRFPPDYQTLIRAELLPLERRLDTLDALVRRSPAFLFGAFRLGDEILHRGPLVGRERLTASKYFANAITIRLDFSPAWEHLAWLRIAEGDEPSAKDALDTLRALGPPGAAPSMIQHLLQAAFAWRFLPPGEAARRTATLIGGASTRPDEPLDAGARYLNHFAAPEGALWLGEQLESRGYRLPSAMLAEVFGALSAGQPDRARRTLARIHAEFGDPDIDLLALELDALLEMFDPDPGAPSWRELTVRLETFATHAPASLRARAHWMTALLLRRYGALRPTPADTAPPLSLLLQAYDAALAGRYAAALAQSEPLTELPAAWVGDPTFRTVLHLLRAEWWERAGKPQDVDPELLWYEISDGISLPTGEPQPMEVDWAFGTLGRWRRARLGGAAATRCPLLRDVARLWAGGEPPYAARADSARHMVSRDCPAG
jgi:protein kinase-like protein